MNNSEIKGLSLDELKSKLTAEKESFAKLKFAHAITPIENPMRLREAKKLVARLNTEIRAKQIAQQ
ncbi:50S ribosomal protein L29 [Reichenbachiella carrageenanivorans]|uniref:Large ribosomal subunit protein uL29 n=1 Tax=Reichenbachiella carrageenanivorans TaxID=2979869 RepID=A0ABY6D4S5_9BACT|nr:50S ribosomal protein L29 [Reichenbachiella carrageenanivorans]UXX81162.1 50S ribosomal protein L29 [Reichenbachiella carrageenanivorans]